MFEYIEPQKPDKETLKGRIITALVTVAFTAGLFAAIYWATSLFW
jgi:hypothetical protein